MGPPLSARSEHSAIKIYHSVNKLMGPEGNITLGCEVTWLRGTSSAKYELGGFYVNDDDPASAEIRGRRVSLDPAGEETILQATTWLEDCLSSHTRCRSPCSDFLPTRLVSIEHASYDSLRLVDGLGNTGIRYAALSYCWGQGLQDRLLLENLQSRGRSFPLSKQPKTIRDAVFVTSKLGLQYLWIDSLCIVQNSREDWERESGSMCDVYSNAYVTIQASSASSSSEGFLGSRKPSALFAARLRYRTRDGTHGSVLIRPTSLNAAIEPLHRRGWTYQEALLSPRVLSFGADEVSWECNTCYESQGGSTKWEINLLAGLLPKAIRTTVGGHNISRQSQLNDGERMKSMSWAVIVQEYSSRALKYPGDKLPALSGLAKAVARTHLEDRYLAGLWKSELPCNLLWTSRPQQAPSRYRAPTWSWASVDGMVYPQWEVEEEATICCQVVHADVTLSGLDPFGQVQAGTITIRAQLQKGWRLVNRNESTQDGIDEVQHFFDSSLELRPEDSAYLLKRGLCELSVVDPAQQLAQPTFSWFMRINHGSGIMLREVTGVSYERIGTFELDGGKESWFEGCPEREIILV